MRDLEALRRRDMDSGHLELYIDDLNFSEYQTKTLMENDICRITEISRDDIHDETIFEKIKETSNFLRDVLDKISNGSASVKYPGVKAYSEKIIEVIDGDIACVLKLDDKTFCHEDLLEDLIVRFITIKMNEFEGVKESQMTEEMTKRFNKYVDLNNLVMEKIERYRNIM